MRFVSLQSLLGVTLLVAISAAAEGPVDRCKNHYILDDPECVGVSPAWQLTSPLGVARYDHAAVLLDSGEVLVMGGWTHGNQPTAGAEIFDPVTNGWRSTGAMLRPRAMHTATRLPDGRVLVTGGRDASVALEPELYDPATGTWSIAGRLLEERYGHTATLLPSGEVLIAGGYVPDPQTGGRSIASTEIFDPASGTSTPTGSLARARYWHSATLLANGTVLVVGGTPDADVWRTVPHAEIYDPATGEWQLAGRVTRGSIGHSAMLLADGRVLVVGGDVGAETALVVALRNAELFDPGTGTWTHAQNLAPYRFGQAAVALPDGGALLAGGGRWRLHLSKAHRFDPDTATWIETLPMNRSRARATMTALQDGRVLVVGGIGFNQWRAEVIQADGEIYAPSARH